MAAPQAKPIDGRLRTGAAIGARPGLQARTQHPRNGPRPGASTQPPTDRRTTATGQTCVCVCVSYRGWAWSTGAGSGTPQRNVHAVRTTVGAGCPSGPIVNHPQQLSAQHKKRRCSEGKGHAQKSRKQGGQNAAAAQPNQPASPPGGCELHGAPQRQAGRTIRAAGDSGREARMREVGRCRTRRRAREAILNVCV